MIFIPNKRRMTELAAENWKRRIKMDILAIAVALALQDGPFFCLRMTLIFRLIEVKILLGHLRWIENIADFERYRT